MNYFLVSYQLHAVGAKFPILRCMVVFTKHPFVDMEKLETDMQYGLKQQGGLDASVSIFNVQPISKEQFDYIKKTNKTQ